MNDINVDYIHGDFPSYANEQPMCSPFEVSYFENQEAFPFSRIPQDPFSPQYGYESFNNMQMYEQIKPMGSPDMHAPSSSMSTASGPSAASSSVGSPYAGHSHTAPVYGLPISAQPSFVGYDSYEYNYQSGFDRSEMPIYSQEKPSFVAPAMMQSYSTQSTQFQPQAAYPPASPALSQRSAFSHQFYHSEPVKQEPESPHPQQQPQSRQRRPSLVSRRSQSSIDSSYLSDSSDKGRCPNPDCGKVFKDLKAHMLTHMNERPEKCPIVTCDYHIKGFARRYDKNRHTLTHYKGTMICGFCPGSGSAAEKSFNRADVFKRHLTSVHGVEQSPPNSRKRTNPAADKGLAGYAPDATGKCSTCSATFTNAQDFYEHLDDCVLRVVQQEDPCESINASRLAEIENDADVHATLKKNNLPTSTIVKMYSGEDEDMDDMDDSYTSSNKRSKTSNRQGLTYSKGGVPLNKKVNRKSRKNYPSSWGCSPQQMKMKKRVAVAFDGPDRLFKDDMMLSSDYEVRIPLADGHYITDLDVQTMRRCEAFHAATVDERGPDFGSYGYDMKVADINLDELMAIKKEEA